LRNEDIFVALPVRASLVRLDTCAARTHHHLDEEISEGWEQLVLATGCSAGAGAGRAPEEKTGRAARPSVYSAHPPDDGRSALMVMVVLRDFAPTEEVVSSHL
jgi:hypothetical protein